MAIDGACRRNKRDDPDSTAAYGIWFGNNCPRNSYGLLPSRDLQTSIRAELHAAVVALDNIDIMYKDGELGGIKHVILKTDSDWLARSMSEWVWIWEEKRGLNSAGKVTAHWEDIKKLHKLIQVFEIERAVAVRFWRVDREWNKAADLLANRPLDEAGLSDSGFEN